MTDGDDASPEPPFVTVVVPCRDEAAYIRPMISGLLSSSYPRDRLEVLFVDGLSTDGTREVLAQAASAHSFVKVIENPGLITPVALNLGIRAARGEVIVRMDAHAEYPADYISRCVALLRSDPRVGSAGGRSVNVPGDDGPWARAAAFVTAHRFGVGNVAYVTSDRPGPVDTVAFGTFRRQVLLDHGLFDERLTRNQDNELHARLQKSGYVILFDPNIVSYYRNKPSLSALARQAFLTGQWNVYTLCLHPYTWKLRRFVPMAFLAYLGLLPWAILARPRWAAAAAAPLELYLMLIAVFSFRSGGKAGDRLRVAATFAAYHLSYGAGPLFGALDVLTGRWRSRLGRSHADPAKPGLRLGRLRISRGGTGDFEAAGDA